MIETATFGAGCFWCFDALVRRLPGILDSVSGYAGGDGPAPTYWDLHTRTDSGFVEAVRVTFDPSISSYNTLLEAFFASHDPTTPNQDGANFGPEYHSTIFTRTQTQRDQALAAVAALRTISSRPIVTTVRDDTTFYVAEPEHQAFYDRQPGHPYCRVVIDPKLSRFLQKKSSPTEPTKAASGTS